MQQAAKQRNMTKSQTACGLDFGTSNSTLGTLTSTTPRLVMLEGRNFAIPSAVFFGTELETKLLIGQAAINAYTEGFDGRLMRSLKSILGSSLIDERTAVYRQRIKFSEVIALFLAQLKERAEIEQQAPLEKVVMGRPVYFVDNDDHANRHAEETLREAAQKIGFREISFQYEPVAAALDFERQHVSGEKIALISDIGGGTADFTVVRLQGTFHQNSERTSDILANDGVRLGGTDFDRQLSMHAFMPGFGYRSLMKRGDIEVPSSAYWDLSTWSNIHQLYDPKRLAELKEVRFAAREPALIDRLISVIEARQGHGVLMSVEEAKIKLSNAKEVEQSLPLVCADFSIGTTQDDFNQCTDSICNKLKVTAQNCVAQAGLTCEDIDYIFFTGGTSQIPNVRRSITSPFSHAEIIDGDRFGAVGIGLTIEAQQRYA